MTCMMKTSDIISDTHKKSLTPEEKTNIEKCCDGNKRKTRGTQKGLIEKHIYSSNRKKIQVNLVKQ